MNFSLLLQQCPACLVHLIWMVCEMRSKWTYISCFQYITSRVCSRQHAAFLCSSCLAFSLSVLLTSTWCNHTVDSRVDTARKKSCFILLVRSDFQMISNMYIAFHAFIRYIFTSISADEMLQPRYVNWSGNFRGLPLRVKMAPFYLKPKNSVLFAFT